MKSAWIKAVLASALACALVLTGCANTVNNPASPRPSETTSNPSITTSMPEPPNESTPDGQSADQTVSLEESLPASYFSTTDEITPETERKIFGDYDETYNVKFAQKTKADLDGDGKEETIELLPGELRKDGDASTYKEYNYIYLKINEEKIKIIPREYSYIGEDYEIEGQLCAYIIDIDKSDGKKEISIDDDMEDWPVSCLVTYEGGEIQQTPWEDDTIRANGTGYIRSYEWVKQDALYGETKGIWIERIKKLSADRSKLIHVDAKYYRCQYTRFGPFDEDSPIATAQWDQMLAKKPGGEEEIPVQKGTGIAFGFYDLSGWMQVITKDGTILGWLDCTKADWSGFTDYLYEWGD